MAAGRKGERTEDGAELAPPSESSPAAGCVRAAAAARRVGEKGVAPVKEAAAAEAVAAVDRVERMLADMKHANETPAAPPPSCLIPVEYMLFNHQYAPL